MREQRGRSERFETRAESRAGGTLGEVGRRTLTDRLQRRPTTGDAATLQRATLGGAGAEGVTLPEGLRSTGPDRAGMATSPRQHADATADDIHFGAGERTPDVATAEPVRVSSSLRRAHPDNSLAGIDDDRAAKTSVSRMVPAGPIASAALGGAWGTCRPEGVVPEPQVTRSGTAFKVSAVDVVGRYSKIVRLLPGIKEAAGHTEYTYMKQCADLDSLGEAPGLKQEWYMLAAVDAHESVHESRLGVALGLGEPMLAARCSVLTVPASTTVKTEAAAETAIKALPAYASAVAELQAFWLRTYSALIDADHRGPARAAERRVVDPKIDAINAWATAQSPALPAYVRYKKT